MRIVIVLLISIISISAEPRFSREQVEYESMKKQADRNKNMIVPRTNWRNLGHHVGCDLCGMMAKDFYQIRHLPRLVGKKVRSICDILASDGQWLKSLDIIQVDNNEDDLGGRYLKLHDRSPDRKDCREDTECPLITRLCDRLVGSIPHNLLVHAESSFEDYKTKICEKWCRQKAKYRKPMKYFEDDTVFVPMSKDEIRREEQYFKNRDKAYDDHMGL